MLQFQSNRCGYRLRPIFYLYETRRLKDSILKNTDLEGKFGSEHVEMAEKALRGKFEGMNRYFRKNVSAWLISS